MNICFFTVANNDYYTHLANTLAWTFKKHTKYTLNVFTDQKDILKNGNQLDLGIFNNDKYFFKFDFFKKISEIIDADYYFFIDADSFIVNNFFLLPEQLESPMFIFLEEPLKGVFDRKWRGMVCDDLNSFFNTISKKNITYYNVNGGFFGFKKNNLNEIVECAKLLFKKFVEKDYLDFTEESILSYLAGDFIDNNKIFLHSNNYHVYATDNLNFFKNTKPNNGYFERKVSISEKKHKITTSIIHLYSNKEYLYNFSKNNLFKINNNFNFIISCSRLKNIISVIESIISNLIPNVNYKIYLNFDLDLNKTEIPEEILNYCRNNPNILIYIKKFNNNIGGHASKNYMLSQIKHGWVYQLDDDNILYPNFFSRIMHFIRENPQKKGFIFRNNISKKELSPDRIKLGVVDTGMFILDRKIVQDENLPEIYGGDGIFIENIYKKHKNEILLIDEILAYYNFLN